MKKIKVAFLIAALTTFVFNPSTVNAEESAQQVSSVPVGDLGYSLGWPDELLVTPNASDTTFAVVNSTNPRLRLIDFYQWTQCYRFNNYTFVLKSYKTQASTAAPGTYVLECGNPDKFGYTHIEVEHGSQWEQKRIQYHVGGSWDDLMNGMAKLALSNPQTSLIKPGDKACYQGIYPVQWSPDCPMQKVTVIISTNNKRVISVYPTLNC